MPTTPERPGVVFMDCDGVIFDANRVKCEAFAYTLGDWPAEAVANVVAHHRANGGVSRYVKFLRFFEEVYPVEDVETAVAAAVQKFGEYRRAIYPTLTPRPAALAFAKACGGPDNVYVVSGSDQTELREIFDVHGIRDAFANVMGSPTSKEVLAARVLEERGCDPADALFLGDGFGDWRAATALGIPFWFLGEMSAWREGPRHVAETPGARLFETWADVLAALEVRS